MGAFIEDNVMGFVYLKEAVLHYKLLYTELMPVHARANIRLEGQQK